MIKKKMIQREHHDSFKHSNLLQQLMLTSSRNHEELRLLLGTEKIGGRCGEQKRRSQVLGHDGSL
jgi:hypothetical protein